MLSVDIACELLETKYSSPSVVFAVGFFLIKKCLVNQIKTKQSNIKKLAFFLLYRRKYQSSKQTSAFQDLVPWCIHLSLCVCELFSRDVKLFCMFLMVMQHTELTFEKYMWLILSPVLVKTSGFPQLPKERTYGNLLICLGGVTNFNHFLSPSRTPVVSPLLLLAAIWH